MAQTSRLFLCFLLATLFVGFSVHAQLIDNTQATNTINAGINKSLTQQIGAGRGSVTTANSSLFIIGRDPFRAVRRGRQLFQRKFTHAQGLGPNVGDGRGNINVNLAIGAGLVDSCAGCHGRPKGSAGFGGDVVTRPDSRDAPHLFGLGLKEMLGDEITTDLRNLRTSAINEARSTGRNVSKALISKGIRYGTITATPTGAVDTSQVDGVDTDLRVRPFFHHGGTFAIREFVVGAFNDEMGLQAFDPDLLNASINRLRRVTPSGMVLDGSRDKFNIPSSRSTTDDPDGDGVVNEVPTSLVDFMEFYLLNYFKPATGRTSSSTSTGLQVFQSIGCTTCHIQNLTVNRDRRVADLDTQIDSRGGFNSLFATAVPSFTSVSDGTSFPPLKKPNEGSFVVRNFFSDLKRHDLGTNFYERNYDGTFRKEFLTTPLWGVGSTGPYGHDGRSMTLMDVIFRHGGEALTARNNFANLSDFNQEALLAFLQSLVLFPPDDTASTLDPKDPTAPNFPQAGHGSIKLTVLFNNPADPE